jgi:glycosyltransferase involved in cell wall biosynthesis
MKRTKILFVTDDIREKTGVGIQAYMLMKGLLKSGEYEIVTIAGSIRPQDPRPVMFEGIKVYPTADGYGNPSLLRAVIGQEKPEITVLFSDPRFFTYAFIMDDEIRKHTKLVFYHTWDNRPFPAYNKVWYAACDQVVMLSKFSYDLMKDNGVDVMFAPHGGDPTEFYPLEPEEVEAIRSNVFGKLPTKPEFVLFYNNRNTFRKRTADIVVAFRRFWQTHPDSVLIMNTAAVDAEGFDLGMIMKQVERNAAPVIINSSKVSVSDLNRFYNLADVTLNVAYNEGFGLSCMESLLAGTPNIAVSTGGLTEQMVCDDGAVNGILLQPTVRTLFGVVGNPYINQDWTSVEDIQAAMEEAYTLKAAGKLRGLGLQGREHIIKNYHTDNTIAAWKQVLTSVLAKPSTFKSWVVHTQE